MMRTIKFVLKLALIAGLVVWLADRPGTAHIVWHEYDIETSAAFLAVVLAFSAFVLFMLLRVWRFFRDGPRFWRLRREIKKIRDGQAQLTEGLVAIAAGDAAEAGRLAISARKLLGTTAATRLLQAQAAQLAGDHRAAATIFLAMAGEPESAVLGYRGLIMSAIREQKWDEAELQTEKLRRLKPEVPWLNLIRFELATRRGKWREASEALAQASAYHLIDASQAKKNQAALMIAASDEESRKGDAEAALHKAELAVKYARDWMPAILTLARKQLAKGHAKATLRTIEKAWENNPHPQLAALYIDAIGNEKKLEIHKRMERLTRDNRENQISQLALAESALAADLWGEARRRLVSLVNSKKASQSVYRLLAKLERRESGDEKSAAQWLMRAAEALPDPRWLCTECGGSHDDWSVICSYCISFNHTEWRIPGKSCCDSVKKLGSNNAKSTYNRGI